MKKFLLLLTIIIFGINSVYGATYTINKQGTVTNPYGKIQQNINQLPTNRSVSNWDNDDIPFSQAQEIPQQKQTSNSQQQTPTTISSTQQDTSTLDQKQKANELKTQNLSLLTNQSQPIINFTQIEQQYGRDPNFYENRQAIINKTKPKGRTITTWTNHNEYSVKYDTKPDVSFFYESVANSVLYRIDFDKKINDTTEISYVYMLSGVFSKTWKNTGIWVINKINGTRYVFGYEKKANNVYTLHTYYINNNAYDANGIYNHTRMTTREEG